ncbi:glycogen debranching protein GlgX [Treponema zioleckii]|uniref:glycogen debranching protein GlgX n=1 Tax=Treponema zioleckii TaxID=331680 RepID=UPI00168A7B26|nr:glycogen debranching protein GlgX [Treponema zioleckii]
MDSIRILPGKPLDNGTQITARGVYFSVFSRHATKVYLELFETEESGQPYKTIELDPNINRTGDLWHVYVEGLKPGALYLYRADGPFDPKKGHRFDKKQYLFDPKAKAFSKGSVFKYLTAEKTQNLAKYPKCVVVDDEEYDWGDDKPLEISLQKSIIYEMHLKGFTASPTSGVEHPGTYLGATEKIPYLQSLGITAVELLPIFEFDEYENSNVNPMTGSRLKNYWGYSTIGFFAPKASFAYDKTPGGAVREFKDMVKAFHNAGIEVILDVVFNHTAEGNEHGITMCFRGLDNSIFYHLVHDQKEYYMNYSGCGNAVNCNHPVVADFIISCLRYWVLEMHVDGFRFDLASVLTRDEKGFLMADCPLTSRISEDSVLRNTKIIAEPWDCDGAYQVGGFPGGMNNRWCEWNDHYRDGIRKFLRGDEKSTTEAATRIAGSSDLFAISGRNPSNSINFITAHDGFTLNDLVTYNYKHNEQNGECNRDGSDNNLSYNYGFEGPVLNPKIDRTRSRQIKNFFTTLFISQGTPMFVAGDEVRRTQGGNNNAYCQDNEISWFNWDDVKNNATTLDFVKKLIAMRTRHPVFQRNRFFGGAATSQYNNPPDISWFDFDGTIPDWKNMNRFLALRLGGKSKGISPEDNDFYIAFNMDVHDLTITIPQASYERKWYRLIDTSLEHMDSALFDGQEEVLNSQEHYVAVANSIVVLIGK